MYRVGLFGLVSAALALVASGIARADTPAWKLNGAALGSPYDDVSALFHQKGVVRVYTAPKADGTGPFPRALLLLEPDADKYRYTDTTYSLTAVVFDETQGHKAVEIMRRQRFKVGEQPGLSSFADAVKEGFSTQIAHQNFMGKETETAQVFLDAQGRPSQAAGCRREAAGNGTNTLLIEGMETWSELDPQCGQLLRIDGVREGKDGLIVGINEHAIDTQAVLNDTKAKIAIRQGALQAQKQSAEAQANKVKPGL